MKASRLVGGVPRKASLVPPAPLPTSRPPSAGSLAAWVLLLLPFALPPHVFAQASFDIWTTENGLPQNSVNDILQTSDGYLWLATFGGLVRFDGVRFVVFDRTVEGIGSQRVRVLFEHSDGTLWAGTENGMLIRFKDGAFTTLGRAEGLPDATAMRIEEDDQGRLWVTWTHEPQRGDVVTKHEGGKVVTYGPEEVPGGPALARRSHGVPDAVWWRHDAAGVHCLHKGRVRLCAPSEHLPRGRILRVHIDHLDTVWVAIAGFGIVQVSAAGSTRLHRSGTDAPEAGQYVRSFTDRRGIVWWVAARRLFRTDSPPAIVAVAENLDVYDIHEDREGTIWLGTDQGLYRWRHHTITMIRQRDGLSADGVYAMLRARDEAVWIGTWGYGISELRDGRINTYGEADGLPSLHVTSLYEAKSGQLWVGTLSGLSSLAGRRFSPYADGSGHLRGAVWAMLEDRAGAFWFATDRGLVRLQGDRADLFTSRDGLPHDRITALAEDRSGALWIGTFQGIARLDNGVFTTWAEHNGLTGSWVRALHEDAEGALWVGTYDSGLYRLMNGQLTRFTTREGLHDNGVFQIFEDDAGYLWMGSNRGISRVSRHELNDVAGGRLRSVRARVFGTRDGMASLECNGGRQPSGLRTADGMLWFPTMAGIAVVDPRTVRTAPNPPPVLIEEAHVQGIAADLKREIPIPHDATSFEIRFTATSFVNPERLRFRHRVIGLDDRWVESGSDRTATYHRLPPGRYQFVVSAAHEDGAWSPDSSPVTVIVLAPFWRQPWFAALAAFAVVVMAVVVDRRRAARHRVDQSRQAAFARRLIETQEAERKRISSELHDSLGQDLFVIRAHVRSAKQRRASDDGFDATLDAIEGVARKASDDLKEVTHALRPYHLDKIGLTSAVKAMVASVGEACGIAVTTDLAECDGRLTPEQQIYAYRIVQECLNNVIKHSGARDAVVRLLVREESLEVCVQDDGIGFRAEAQGLSATGDHGLGLMDITERARAMGGQAEIRSAPGAGTSVTVTLPLARHDGC